MLPASWNVALSVARYSQTPITTAMLNRTTFASSTPAEGGRTSMRRTASAAAVMPAVRRQHRACRQREKEDGAHRQHDGAAGRHQEPRRHAEAADAREERHGDAPDQVAARAARDVAGGRGGHDDERLDEERADDLEAHDDREREEEREEIFEVGRLGSGDRGERRAQAVEQQVVVFTHEQHGDEDRRRRAAARDRRR